MDLLGYNKGASVFTSSLTVQKDGWSQRDITHWDRPFEAKRLGRCQRHLEFPICFETEGFHIWMCGW